MQNIFIVPAIQHGCRAKPPLQKKLSHRTRYKIICIYNEFLSQSVYHKYRMARILLFTVSNYFLGRQPIEYIYLFLILHPLSGVYRETFV